MTRTACLLRSLAAPIAGYAAVAIGTTIVFTLVHGINLQAPQSHLIVGVPGIMLAGMVGGWIAAWIGGRRPIAHAASVLILLAADSTTVLFFRHRRDPLWFGLLSALGLMAATVAGGILRAAYLARRARPAAGNAAG